MLPLVVFEKQVMSQAPDHPDLLALACRPWLEACLVDGRKREREREREREKERKQIKTSDTLVSSRVRSK